MLNIFKSKEKKVTICQELNEIHSVIHSIYPTHFLKVHFCFIWSSNSTRVTEKGNPEFDISASPSICLKSQQEKGLIARHLFHFISSRRMFYLTWRKQTANDGSEAAFEITLFPLFFNLLLRRVTRDAPYCLTCAPFLFFVRLLPC